MNGALCAAVRCREGRVHCLAACSVAFIALSMRRSHMLVLLFGKLSACRALAGLSASCYKTLQARSFALTQLEY